MRWETDETAGFAHICMDELETWGRTALVCQSVFVVGNSNRCEQYICLREYIAVPGARLSLCIDTYVHVSALSARSTDSIRSSFVSRDHESSGLSGGTNETTAKKHRGHCRYLYMKIMITTDKLIVNNISLYPKAELQDYLTISATAR